MFLYQIAKAILTPIAHLLYRIKFNGRENVPENGNFLICGNHTNWVDPVFLALSVKPTVHFMAKKELFKGPFLSWLLRNLGVFPVNRDSKRNDSDSGRISGLKSAMDIVKDGGIVGLFPEGTRVHSGQEIKAKAGVAIIAAWCDAKILPVGIKGPVHMFGKVTVNIGKPLCFPKDEYGRLEHDEYEKLSQEVLSEIKRLRDL